MSVQILGLREFFDSRQKKPRKYEAFFEKGWRAQSVADIFSRPDEFIAQIPEDERYNLYYTVAHCLEEKGRKLMRQTVIPFDVDGIEEGTELQVATIMCSALGVDFQKSGVCFSGNGVQVLIDSAHEITSTDTFDTLRPFYKACCGLIDLALQKAGVKGHADVSVWSPARLMRLPNTKNIKPEKPERMARVLNGHMERQDFDLKRASKIPEVQPEEQVSQLVLDRFPKPDTKAVLSECEFLTWTKANQKKTSELQWYAMLSIVGRLEGGQELAHEYSKEHPSYSRAETELKLEQALANAGPRTCKNINSMFPGCSACKHYGSKLVSPIMIQGPDYIKTEKTGFHQITTDQHGNPKPGKPVVEDLRKFFEREYQYVTIDETKVIFTWDGKRWAEMMESRILGFAYEHFNPKVTETVRKEFLHTLQCTNLKPLEWLDRSTHRRINFNNGVLDIDEGTFVPHSPAFGFRYVLPYDYDTTAECPAFDRFMRDVTCDRKPLEDVLLEFMGYAFSGDDCWIHKALMLIGQGSNGKSTLMHVLELLAGKGTFSSVTLSEMKNEAMRYQLEGRLFNMAEETAKNALVDSSIFKNLVSGGQMIVKRLWVQPYSIRNKCKLIFSCNELPHSQDKTGALYRRLLIVPFDNKFEGAKEDPLIKERLAKELPGIFNRVLEGYRRLRKNKRFSESEAIKEQLEMYEKDNDAVLTFVQDELVIEAYSPAKDAAFTSTLDIYQAYRMYCELQQGEKPLTAPQFWRLMKYRIADYDRRFERKVLKSTGKRERILVGVLLAKNAKVKEEASEI